MGWESSKKLSCKVAALSSTRDFHRLASSFQAFTTVYPKRHFICRPNSVPISLQESASYGDNSLEGEKPSRDSEEETLTQPLTREQVFFFYPTYKCLFEIPRLPFDYRHVLTLKTPEIEEIHLNCLTMLFSRFLEQMKPLF